MRSRDVARTYLTSRKRRTLRSFPQADLTAEASNSEAGSPLQPAPNSAEFSADFSPSPEDPAVRATPGCSEPLDRRRAGTADLPVRPDPPNLAVVPHHELQSVRNGLTGSSVAVLSLFMARPSGAVWRLSRPGVPHSCHNGRNLGGSGRTGWHQEDGPDLPVHQNAQVSDLGEIDFPS